MSSPNHSCHPVRVIDVYELAAEIGKEFEKLIDGYGTEPVLNLMPKVITVLEQLEFLADCHQKENDEVAELRYSVEQLQAERLVKVEEREKYEKVSSCTDTVLHTYVNISGTQNNV